MSKLIIIVDSVTKDEEVLVVPSYKGEERLFFPFLKPPLQSQVSNGITVVTGFINQQEAEKFIEAVRQHGSMVEWLRDV